MWRRSAASRWALTPSHSPSPSHPASLAKPRPTQAFVVRKEPGHGRGKRIEGNFAAGDTVVVVDDVITTGDSTLKAIEAIEAEGGKIAFALILVDRQEGGHENIEGKGYPVVAAFTRADLVG